MEECLDLIAGMAMVETSSDRTLGEAIDGGIATALDIGKVRKPP
ncbi:unannotated protein [freshwater metagenome]|uniref:Unannotated protein n=1 Tax=freshwater metagenome TaxID=449393 RepID=A0A6J6E7Y2_9ZZZZ